MERWQGRVAVVTGASAGIGAAIVEDLVGSGMRVVGLARRHKLLEELKTKLKGKSGTLYPLETDITNDTEVIKAFKWIKDNLGGVDVMVNNAGIFIKGFVSDGSMEDLRKMYEVNVFGMTSCSREAIKLMKEKEVNDGLIININSVASYRLPVISDGNPYSTSKFASKAITESLRRELANQNSKIRVTSISPGLVQTEIFEANNSQSAINFDTKPHLKAKDIADAVHYVLSTPPHIQVNELILRPVGDGI